MTANYADLEGRNDWLANRPEVDVPDLADIAAEMSPPTTDPNARQCMGAWVRHTRQQWSACPFCGGAS